MTGESMRSVQNIYDAVPVNMGGVILDQALPLSHVPHDGFADPYLLLHHWKTTFPGQQHPRDLGVGPHPHRGFCPVTVIYQGALQHRDSLGNNHIVQAGGVQWMFAGKGITHSERPPSYLAAEGGEFEIIQFWVNVPAKIKMQPAKYHPLQFEEIPTVSPFEGLEVQVIAGSYEDVRSPIPIYSDLLILNISLESGAAGALKIPATMDLQLYIVEGYIETGKHRAKGGPKQLLLFDTNKADLLNLYAKEKSKILLLAGIPLREKVNQYGPFVMNTQSEILQALRDAQMGKMGILIEAF